MTITQYKWKPFTSHIWFYLCVGHEQFKICKIYTAQEPILQCEESNVTI